MLRVVILAVFLSYACAGTPTISECLDPESETSKVTDVTMTVTDCTTPERCLLIRNTTHNITMTFRTLQATEGLKMFVYGKVIRVRVPYVRRVDLCANTIATDGTTCAENSGLLSDKTYTLNYPFYIRSQFPEWKVPVEFELWDNNGKLNCIRVNVEIRCNLETEATCRRTTT